MNCPICDFPEAVILSEPMSNSLRVVNCMTCVDYRLVGIGMSLSSEMRQTRHLMAGLLAERKIRGEGPMEIRGSQWDRIVSTAPTTFTEQIDRFLVNLSKKSSEGGMMTALSSALHAPWAFAAARDSLVYRLRTLAKAGFIEMQGERGAGGSDRNDLGFVLTYEGWKRVEELEAKAGHSDQAFIALTKRPGDKPEPRMEAVIKALKEGIQAAGYRPIFMEDLQHGDKIDDRILVEIKRSRFLVVDTTGRNANVTFEAGYALGLGRTILWTCREGDHDDQDFDIRQYRRLLWAHGGEEVLTQKLQDAVEQVVGRGPLAKAV